MRAAHPTRRGQVDLDATRERLLRLGLAHAAEHVGEQLARATKEELAPHRFLDGLLESELGVREERRMKTSLRLSGLPPGQTLGNLSFQPSLERSRIETLGTCAWIREKERTHSSRVPRAWARPTWRWRWRYGRWATASRWRSTAWRTFWRRSSAMRRSVPSGCVGAST